MIPKFTIRSLFALTALVGLLCVAIRGIQMWQTSVRRQELNQIRLHDPNEALDGRSFMINHRLVSHVPVNLTANECFDQRPNRDVAPEFGEIHFSPLGMFVEDLTSGGGEAALIFVRATDGDACSFETPFGRSAMFDWLMEGINFSKGTYPTVRPSRIVRRAHDAIHIRLVGDLQATVTVRIETSKLFDRDLQVESFRLWFGRFDTFQRIHREVVNVDLEADETPLYYETGSMDIADDGNYWVAIDAVRPRRDPKDVFKLVPKCFEVKTLNGIRELRILGE